MTSWKSVLSLMILQQNITHYFSSIIIINPTFDYSKNYSKYNHCKVEACDPADTASYCSSIHFIIFIKLIS